MKLKILDEQPLELEFQDGTKLTALFNNMAFITLNDEFGEGPDKEVDITKLVDKANPYPGFAKILYCGLKQCHPQITLDEAENIMYKGGSELMMSVCELMIRNFNVTSNDETKKKYLAQLTEEQKKVLEQMGLALS